MSDDWLTLIEAPKAEEETPLLETPPVEATLPELTKLSLERRLEILRTPLPDPEDARFVPMATLVSRVATSVTTDAIKIGEAQLKPRKSYYHEIKEAMEAYKARLESK